MHHKPLILIRWCNHPGHLRIAIEKLALRYVVAFMIWLQGLDGLYWTQIRLRLINCLYSILIVVAASDLWIKRLYEYTSRITSLLSSLTLIEKENLSRIIVFPHHAGPVLLDMGVIYTTLLGATVGLVFPETPFRRWLSISVHGKSHFYFTILAII